MIHLSPLVNASCPAVCVVGKAWDFHVKTALGIKNEDNLLNIKETAKHIVKNKKEFYLMLNIFLMVLSLTLIMH